MAKTVVNLDAFVKRLVFLQGINKGVMEGGRGIVR